MSAPLIQFRDAVPYVGVSRVVADGGVPAAVDPAFPMVLGWLRAHDVQPTGPPFVRVCSVDAEGDPLALEVGVPVAASVGAADGGDVFRCRLPAGRYVTQLHVGPYRSAEVRDLGAARAELLEWMARRGIACGTPAVVGGGMELACAVDHLRVSPGTEPDWRKWETELAYLIVEP